MVFLPIFPKIFLQDIYPKHFLPKFTPNIYPHYFAPRFSPIALRLLPPNFPLVFPPKKFSILIINFYPLLFSLKFFPHSSQNCAPICLPPSLLPNLPPRFFPIVLRLLPSNCPPYFPPKICLPNILPLPLPLTFYPHFLPPSFSPIVFRIVPQFPSQNLAPIFVGILFKLYKYFRVFSTGLLGAHD